MSARRIGEVSANTFELVDRGNACGLDVSEGRCQIGRSIDGGTLILAAQPFGARPVEEGNSEFSSNRRQSLVTLYQIGAVECDQANARPNEYNQLVDRVRSWIQMRFRLYVRYG